MGVVRKTKSIDRPQRNARHAAPPPPGRSSAWQQFVSLHRNHLLIGVLLFTNTFTLMSMFREDPKQARESNDPIGGLPKLNVTSFRFSNVTQRTFIRGHGLQGFVFFSAYRINANSFVVIGLSPLMLHHGLDARLCRWWPGSGDEAPILGRIAIEYPGEAHQKTYEVIMLFCTLKEGTPASKGGHLTVIIDKEEIIVYGEPRNKNLPLVPGEPYASSITYCSQPIYGNFNEQRVVEWVEFHRIGHGVDRFHLYDVGQVADNLLLVLKAYIGNDVMTLTDISEVNQYESWYAQVLAMNDCVYRSLFESKWVLFLDLDEYLYVTPSQGNLLQVLSHHEGQAWVSFGSEFFFTKMCSHSLNITLSENATDLEILATRRWEVERMIFKQSEIHCVAVSKHTSRFLCLGYDGHRKYIADPRRIQIAGIHSVTKPTRGGIDLDARDVHLNHYRGLNTNYITSCAQFIHDTDWIPKSWLRDFSMQRLAEQIRYRTLKASLSRMRGKIVLDANQTIMELSVPPPAPSNSSFNFYALLGWTPKTSDDEPWIKSGE